MNAQNKVIEVKIASKIFGVSERSLFM